MRKTRKIMKGCAKKLRGGNFFHKIPAPLVGPAWPGAGSNHYALNTYNNQLLSGMASERNQITLKGGRRRRSRQHMRGGLNLIPNDVLNLARYGSYNSGSFYNGYLGYKPPVNPLPWSQKL
jgi:hypothetical protein